jgi:Amt family ammonium transporter
VTVAWAHKGHPSVLGAAAGAVAGLVGITPAAGFVTPSSAILIGLGAGVICYFAIQLRERLRVDDALDVWAVHGVGGMWGALATGLFATTSVNAAGKDGLLYGNPSLFVSQLIAVVVAVVFSGVATFIILKIVDAVIGLRVPEQEEVLGLDLSQHGEPAYQL